MPFSSDSRRVPARDKRTSRKAQSNFPYQQLEAKILLAGDFDVMTEIQFAQWKEQAAADRFAEVTGEVSSDRVWKSVSKDVLTTQQVSADKVNYIQASSFNLYELDNLQLKQALENAPLEFTPGYEDQAVVLTVAKPDRSFAQFKIVEAPIMETALAEQFPDIKTYRGIGIDDPGDTIRLDVTPQGFHAAVRSAAGDGYYIDPYFHLDDSLYTSYFTQDLIVDPARAAIAETLYSDTGELIYSTDFGIAEDAARDIDEHGHDSSDGPIFDGGFGFGTHGADLRTFELAVAATGEYTTFHGGTVAGGQAAIVTAMNRVVGIYENDVAVRMVLVGNNSNLVYTNAGTDPYTNSNGVAMLGENQANVDTVIGDANYDVGHVFSTGGGGVASLGVIGQSGAKARGVTGLGSPIGDPFYVDFVAHEMGHQFSGTHTFNGDSGSCAGGNRTGGTAYEPGSGTTIMAYAGICGDDNLQSNSDAFFHSASIDQIRTEVTTGTGDAAATVTNTGNQLPTVNAGADFVIPDQTPFELTAIGSDADAGDVLTYSWEQRDLGAQRDVNGTDNGSSPIFRSWDPTTNSTRTFPRLTNLLAGSTVIGEQLPTTNWNSMDFRVVVRDNAMGGGGVSTDDMTLQVVDSGTGFAITSQNASTEWDVGATETITWNVAGTTANGINTANVDILFALDGINYSTVLATGVANNGTHDIVVPDVETALGRIKIKAVGNVFFDINDSNITIGVETAVKEYSSTDTPTNITDLNTIQSTITIPDDGDIIDLDLQLDIEHTWIQDLTTTLTSPSGAVFTLFARIGAANDANFEDTYFDDGAATAIADGTAPYAGTFRPTDSFGPLNSTAVAGDWVLSISDAANQDEGVLTGWSLFVTLPASNTDLVSVVDSDGDANSVSEGSSVGTTVGITVFAVEPDAGDTVTYALTDNAGGLFSVNANSGVVTVNGTIDYETATSYPITVEATSTDGSSVSENFIMAVANIDDAALTARNISYQGSSFDDGGLGAVATDKSVLLPGETATFANYTSYSLGINSFVIDVQDLNVAPTLATFSSYFGFHVGNNDDPTGWATAAAPTGLIYQSNVDAGGTDRIFLTWADNAIEKTWLEITVLANSTTGLATPDVFYIGNAIGETGNTTTDAGVDLADVGLVRINQTGFDTTDVLNVYDFNRDARVTLDDLGLARVHQSGFSLLNLITPGGSNRGFASNGKGDGANGGSGGGSDLFAFANRDQNGESELGQNNNGEQAIQRDAGEGFGSLTLAGSQSVADPNVNVEISDNQSSNDDNATNVSNTTEHFGVKLDRLDSAFGSFQF